MSGLVSYLSGLSAEQSVTMHYEARGCRTECQRWRGRHGEIDLITRDGADLVFVEVKKSKDFLRAAERVTRAQVQRIQATIFEFLEAQPNGQLTPFRFDVALVNAKGEMQIIENALAY
ncbi:YraN family protein [uncultured Aliiroseovarius sp.]|uniref:YraN family protein n=1 Tax=uncultured Aliiroseovarius sp. TaxID=1658783 RepID=UPI0026164ACB|nr:YraN family protein [uncultured Aliiroseovarius sp.]